MCGRVAVVLVVVAAVVVVGVALARLLYRGSPYSLLVAAQASRTSAYGAVEPESDATGERSVRDGVPGVHGRADSPLRRPQIRQRCRSCAVAGRSHAAQRGKHRSEMSSRRLMRGLRSGQRGAVMAGVERVVRHVCVNGGGGWCACCLRLRLGRPCRRCRGRCGHYCLGRIRAQCPCGLARFESGRASCQWSACRPRGR